MFTGIVSGIGRVAGSAPLGGDASHGRRLAIEVPAGFLDDVRVGDSIALGGACMTATSVDAAAARFTVDVSAESLSRTGEWAVGTPLNLEKALAAGDRLGGHLVAGHVDSTGVVSRFAAVGESFELRIAAPGSLRRFLAPKGSIAVDGVSLTVNDVEDRFDDAGHEDPRCEFSVNLIPHTLEQTTLGRLVEGAAVNLEVDLIARYVERMLGQRAATAAISSIP